MAHVFHISFATSNYSKSAWRLKASGRKFGLNTFIFSSRDSVVTDLRRRAPGIADRPRGAGYWLWKPAIISHTLWNTPDGSIIFYTDAGMAFVADPRPLLEAADASGVILFSLDETNEERRMRYWTKRDAFMIAGCDDEQYWNMTQANASSMLIKNSANARQFLADWLSLCMDRRAITDDPNELGRANLPEFRDHRHDQALLTLVAAKWGLPLAPDATQYGPIDRPYPQIFDHHRHRNRGGLSPLHGLTMPWWVGRLAPSDVALGAVDLAARKPTRLSPRV